MDRNAKLDQQQYSLLATFYTFITKALIVILTRPDICGIRASFSYSPCHSEPLHNDHLPPSQADQLYVDALTLLSTARVVARMLSKTIRETAESAPLAEVGGKISIRHRYSSRRAGRILKCGNDFASRIKR